MTLTDIELRVLGVLIEKSLTQAGGYPMTMNALVLGCNQKQNRDPVVEFAEGDVARALHALQVKGLVKESAPAPGARATRFAHHVLDKFRWDRRQQAVMAELMLRGRQTPGELRTHASRMTPFDDLPAITVVLNELKNAETPFVEELPREPGRSADRFRHLLGEPVSTTQAAMAGSPLSTAHDPNTPQSPRLPSSTTETPFTDTDLQAVRERLSQLEERVERLARMLERPSPPALLPSRGFAPGGDS